MPEGVLVQRIPGTDIAFNRTTGQTKAEAGALASQKDFYVHALPAALQYAVQHYSGEDPHYK